MAGYMTKRLYAVCIYNNNDTASSKNPKEF